MDLGRLDIHLEPKATGCEVTCSNACGKLGELEGGQGGAHHHGVCTSSTGLVRPQLRQSGGQRQPQSLPALFLHSIIARHGRLVGAPQFPLLPRSWPAFIPGLTSPPYSSTSSSFQLCSSLCALLSVLGTYLPFGLCAHCLRVNIV